MFISFILGSLFSFSYVLWLFFFFVWLFFLETGTCANLIGWNRLWVLPGFLLYPITLERCIIQSSVLGLSALAGSPSPGLLISIHTQRALSSPTSANDPTCAVAMEMFLCSGVCFFRPITTVYTAVGTAQHVRFSRLSRKWPKHFCTYLLRVLPGADLSGMNLWSIRVNQRYLFWVALWSKVHKTIVGVISLRSNDCYRYHTSLSWCSDLFFFMFFGIRFW